MSARRGRSALAAIALLLAGCGAAPASTEPSAAPWCHDPAGVGTPVRVDDGRATFAVYAPERRSVRVVVYDADRFERRDAVELRRHDADGGCTVWQGTLEVGDGAFAYRLEVDGEVMPDPWSLELDPTGRFSVHDPSLAPAAPLPLPPTNGTPPLYEAHVAASTAADPTIDEQDRCTYRGLAGTVDDLARLGVRAVHLLPITATTQVTARGTAAATASSCGAMRETAPDTDDRPAFHKGYDVASISALNPAYGDGRDLQALVRRYHDHGIAVYLDAVFTHLAPGSLLEQLDRDTYLDFDGSGRADLDSATDADSSPYGPLPAVDDPTVAALVAGALRRTVETFGVDGLRVDGMALLRTYQHDAQQVALDLLAGLVSRHPDLDVVLETLPLRTTGPVAEHYWQEDGGPSEAIDELLQALVAGDRPRTEAAVAWFRHVAAPSETEAPARRLVFGPSHDHRGPSGHEATPPEQAALVESATAGLLALTTGRVQLADAQECATGAVTPRPPYLVAVEAAEREACDDAGLRSFVELLLASPPSTERGEPVPVLVAERALVLSRAGRLLVVNLADQPLVLDAPLCVGEVLATAGTFPAAGSFPATGTCFEVLPPASVGLATAEVGPPDPVSPG